MTHLTTDETKIAFIQLMIDEKLGEFRPVAKKEFLCDLVLTKATRNVTKIGPLLIKALDTAPLDNPNRMLLVHHLACFSALKIEDLISLRKIEEKWVFSLLNSLTYNARTNRSLVNPRIIKVLGDLSKITEDYTYCFGSRAITQQVKTYINEHTAPKSLSTLTVCNSKFFTFYHSLKQKQSDLCYHSNFLLTS